MVKREIRSKPDINLVHVSFSRWTWQRRGALFLSAFAGAWLFVESFLALSGVTAPRWRTYAALVIFAASVPVLSETASRRKTLGSVESIDLMIILASTGRRLKVLTPFDLNVGSFVDAVLKRVEKIAPFDNTIWPLYAMNLMVRHSNGYVGVDNDMTLREAGIQPGDECKIRGYIRMEYTNLKLSGSYGLAKAHARELRERGEGLFDEHVAQLAAKFQSTGLRICWADVFVVRDNQTESDMEKAEVLVRIGRAFQALQRVGYKPSEE